MSPFNYFFDTFISRACTDSDFNLVRTRTRHNEAIANGLNGCVALSQCIWPSANWMHESHKFCKSCIWSHSAIRMHWARSETHSAHISFPTSSAYGTIWPTLKSHFSAFTCAQWHTRVEFVIFGIFAAWHAAVAASNSGRYVPRWQTRRK